MSPPLEGVRVVDLTHTIFGRSCGAIQPDLRRGGDEGGADPLRVRYRLRVHDLIASATADGRGRCISGVLESEPRRQAFVVDPRPLGVRLFVDELTPATALPTD